MSHSKTVCKSKQYGQFNSNNDVLSKMTLTTLGWVGISPRDEMIRLSSGHRPRLDGHAVWRRGFEFREPRKRSISGVGTGTVIKDRLVTQHRLSKDNEMEVIFPRLAAVVLPIGRLYSSRRCLRCCCRRWSSQLSRRRSISRRTPPSCPARSRRKPRWWLFPSKSGRRAVADARSD